MSRANRNDPCPCGSGKKYKLCCLPREKNPAANNHAMSAMIPKNLQAALAHHRAGRLPQAQALYRQILQVEPNQPDALHLLGRIAYNEGKNELAVELISKAVSANPSEPTFYNALGLALEARGNLAVAADSYRQAIRLMPGMFEAYFNLGNTLQLQGKLGEAVEMYNRTLSLKPDYAMAHRNLGIALRNLGKLDEALACFQHQIRLTPGDAETLHLIASLTGDNIERASVQYVEGLFDGYADKFDANLQQALKYEAPEKLVALVLQHSTPPAEKWNILDLGCGTGLAGAAIAPYARQLVGVDLSTKMLEKAHARNLYQRLECSDLLIMMRGEKDSSYDIIIAADVFIYLGKLNEIISETKRLLGPGGILAFSIETLEALSDEGGGPDIQREYQLEKTSRYTHSTHYITRLASANSFSHQEITATQLRMENGRPVNGNLVLLKS
jgi:predicted TPR repeat methyltransferase